MSTKEEQETLRLLVQHVSRSFYEPKYIVIMDQLARHPVLKDDDLAGRMGLQAKELNKLMAVLNNDRLIRVHRQNELKEGAQRSVGRAYYYIDYQHFCNVVKWRVAEMRRIIDNSLRNELDNKGYICPQCNKSFTPLEVDKLIDFSRGVFICDDCKGELVDNENAESVRGSQDRMQRFNRQMAFIREGLRKTEDMVLPAFDVEAWVRNNLSEAEKQRNADAGAGLKIAGSGPKTEDAGIGVVMSLDKDEETRIQERNAEAAAKRQQNLMPSWHLKSTITGDLTALGEAENNRAPNGSSSLPGGTVLSSNDAILRGLAPLNPTPTAPVVEDIKPVQTQEADYYDQYYASLEASNAASSQGTPSAYGYSNGVNGADEEEEDVKPSIEYLDSLNEYRKRSRPEQVDVAAEMRKSARLDEEGNRGTYTVEAVAPVEAAAEAAEIEVDATDDPLVQVNGQPVRYSEVTEEHQEMMTPEEYQAYYEIMQARS
ncbi:hypothetical protein GLOTRDRAFT_140654 [Gloeophyllum trabeum ATCC 11539]|uniref:HTH TFE/IIEalpha-type domain-containing protein n=1 Tax=Gloeophyllum trabeum (strain ATCC 11539 / FP-39264 / Madison 617) TaxID=670483 RepID=S7PXM5_GLOTA|nr:uncharacterized protein GLOTRDRAFT_140654 [Gloeophyllum trabeum ATCC 11539]EPQ52268.1 hypothetical protein GLOTRDRAFT_140654 [Gloeophyllum trabeum ATCC 11539]